MEIAEVIAREAIRNTLSRYTLAGDRGQLHELARCFAEEGVLDVEGGWVARGRREVFERTSSALPSTENQRDSPLLRHHLSTQVIELVSETEARAWTYFSVLSEKGLDHQGRYIDRLRRVGGEWLIAHRRVVIEWYAAETVYPEYACDLSSGRRRRSRKLGG